MRALEPWHLLVLLVVVMVLFGGKKLPEAARGLGRSMRIFKSEVKEMREEDQSKASRGPVEGRIVGEEGPARSRADFVDRSGPIDRPEPVSRPAESRDA